jgi:hypothetical protein
MSMNWRIPCPAMKRTARRRNARFCRASIRISGIAAATRSTASRSTW